VEKMFISGVSCNLCEQAYESIACLPTSFGLFEEQVKYMGAYNRQQQNPYSNNFYFGWLNCQNFSWGGINNFQLP